MAVYGMYLDVGCHDAMLNSVTALFALKSCWLWRIEYYAMLVKAPRLVLFLLAHHRSIWIVLDQSGAFQEFGSHFKPINKNTVSSLSWL